MTYLLDTVTISAFRREGRTPDEVLRWAASLDVPYHYLSVISLNEIRFGIRTVEAKDPDFGRELQNWYESIVNEERYYRILPVDREIAEIAALYRADHETPYYDSLIAATAQVHGLTLATRNTAGFAACGISLINPWEYGA
ncbi:MAG: type II toxin-antitoxin system VapC family toxin [Luteolibacter sp.]